MQVIKKLILFLFTIWAVIALIVSLLIITPIYAIIFLLLGKKGGPAAHGLSRIWGTYVLLVCGLRLKVHGRKKLDPGETYVFISNHRSQLDIPLASRATTHFFKFLSKAELGKIPLLGYIIRKLYITVERKNARDGVRALEKMKKSLDEGISIWLFPEGTRNKTDAPLADFYDGAFQVAVNSGKPIAVLTIIDTGKLSPPGSLFISPGKVNAYWDEPISTVGLNRKDIPALREKARQLMINQIERHRHNRS